MAKRKKTDIVQFKLRIREGLRRRLEAAANAEERSLNSEIAHRLENSFDQEKNSLVLEALLAPGAGLELIRNVGRILRGAGPDWYNPQKSHAVAEAIRKVIAVISGELPPTEASFPNRNDRASADQLAWLASLGSNPATPTTKLARWRRPTEWPEPEREEAATPVEEFIRAMDKDQEPRTSEGGDYNERPHSRTR